MLASFRKGGARGNGAVAVNVDLPLDILLPPWWNAVVSRGYGLIVKVP
jgi:hypothetical protein